MQSGRVTCKSCRSKAAATRTIFNARSASVEGFARESLYLRMRCFDCSIFSPGRRVLDPNQEYRPRGHMLHLSRDVCSTSSCEASSLLVVFCSSSSMFAWMVLVCGGLCLAGAGLPGTDLCSYCQAP